MIVFKNIEYANILSVGNQPMNTDLNKHRKTLVTGRNGAGKSTFLEALCFGLYGKSFRGLTKAQLVNSVNKRATVVNVEFDVNGVEYSVTRGIKKNIFQIYKNGQLVDESASVAAYQEYLEKQVLQMSLTTFKQIVILGTAGYTPFMKLPAGQRREIIENLLDIGVFSVMSKVNKADVKTIKEGIKDLENSIANAKDKIRILAQHEKERTGNLDAEIEVIESRINAAQEKIKGINVIIADEQEVLLEQQKDMIDSVATEIEAAVLDFSNTMAEVRQFKESKEYLENNDTCEKCHQDIDPEFKEKLVGDLTDTLRDTVASLNNAKQKVEALKEQQAKHAERNQAIAQTQSKIDSLERDKLQAQNGISSLESDIERLKGVAARDSKKNEIKGMIEDVRKDESAVLADQNELYCRQVVEAMLKDNGVKALIIRKYIPAINKFINKYLQAMDATYNFTIDEEFNETIKSRGRDAFSYDSFSQGERARIDLAILFAFRDLVKLRSGSSTNLLVLDEVFDSANDEDGVKALSSILDDMDDNIIVISHNDKHDMDSFDRHIQLKKVGQFTKEV